MLDVLFACVYVVFIKIIVFFCVGHAVYKPDGGCERFDARVTVEEFHSPVYKKAAVLYIYCCLRIPVYFYINAGIYIMQNTMVRVVVHGRS